MTLPAPTESGLPVTLLTQGRVCLAIGGGKTALTKIRLLLEAGALVRVVASEACEEVAELAREGRIEWRQRPFEEDDLAGAFVVYAATNDRAVNRRALDLCRKRNLPCACVDGNWAQGDFVTPAVVREGDLSVAIGSGGNAGRRARLIGDALARQLRMMDSARLVVVGTDHRHLTLEEREPFHLTGPRFDQAGFMIMQLRGIHEFVLLNTCNRVEIVAVVSEETSRNGILRHVLGFSRLKEDKFYLKTDERAFEHLCLTVSGMLSQTPGENHVTAQVKEALDLARRRGWAGALMQEWVSSALRVSKAIKNRVAAPARDMEIEDLVLRYLAARRPDLNEASVLLLGAGVVGRSLAEKLLPEARRLIWCYHVNRPAPPSDPARHAELCTFGELRDRLAQADVVLSAADAPGHLLHAAHAPFLDPERNVLLIDLGMPRNLDPALGEISPQIELVDLDALKYWHRRELVDLDALLARCRAIVNEHAALYEKTAGSFNRHPIPPIRP